jgi:anti-anti-sigma factor
MKEQTEVMEGPNAVIQPDADLVSLFLPALRSKMREMVDSGVRHLTVDLTKVQMVDSSGLGLLMAAHNSLKKAGGELEVVHASEDILHLFRTMRMHQHFSVSGN